MARLVRINGTHYLASGAGYYDAEPPALALSVVSTDFSEGAEITLRVTASAVWNEDIAVAYATSDGTATAGVDYTAASGTATITAGATTADIQVSTIDRSGVQADRAFTVTLSSPTTPSGSTPTLATAAQTVTIDDTDVEEPIPHIVVSALASADEGEPLTFRIATVDLAPTPAPITFFYATSEAGTAVNGVDYTATAGNGFIATGASFQDVPVQTINRAGFQAGRTVGFVISDANTTIDTATATGLIQDVDVDGSGNALFDAMTDVNEPTRWKSIGFRSQGEINTNSQGGINTEIIYAPGTDTHPYAQDAAKITIPAYEDTTTVLTQDLAADATSVMFVSAGQTDGRGLLLSAGTPNEEYVQVVTGNSASGYTITRGRYGTTPRAHTAATSVLRRSKNKLDSQIRLRLNTANNYSYYSVVDTFWTDSVMNTPNLTFKLFQFSSPGDRIWVEPRLVFSGGNAISRPDDWDAAVYCGVVDVRTYENGGGVVPWIPTEQRHGAALVRVGQNMTPQVGRFGVKPNVWTRWHWKFEQIAGDYDSFSFWMSDETRDPVLIIDALPVNIGRGTGTDEIDRWWLEMDTSVEADIRGDLDPYIAYIRNFAINRGALGTDWSSFLVRP